MELQHLNVKLMLAPVDEPLENFLGRLIPVFHAWIRDQRAGDLLLDVADYRHVPAGPGVIVIGYEGNYSVDHAGGRLGVRYNRKAPLEGANRDRLLQATRAALEACQRLEAEPLLGGKLRFAGSELQIFANDRLLAPNDEATREALRNEFETFAGKLFAGSSFSFAYDADPRSLLTAAVRAAEPFSVSALLANLNF